MLACRESSCSVISMLHDVVDDTWAYHVFGRHDSSEPWASAVDVRVNQNMPESNDVLQWAKCAEMARGNSQVISVVTFENGGQVASQ